MQVKITVASAELILRQETHPPNSLFVVLSLGRQCHRSSGTNSGRTPQWNQSFIFNAEADNRMCIQVMAQHQGYDQQIGSAWVDLRGGSGSGRTEYVELMQGGILLAGRVLLAYQAGAYSMSVGYSRLNGSYEVMGGYRGDQVAHAQPGYGNTRQARSASIAVVPRVNTGPVGLGYSTVPQVTRSSSHAGVKFTYGSPIPQQTVKTVKTVQRTDNVQQIGGRYPMHGQDFGNKENKESQKNKDNNKAAPITEETRVKNAEQKQMHYFSALKQAVLILIDYF